MNTSISPARLPATPVVASPPVTPSPDDVGLSFNDCGVLSREQEAPTSANSCVAWTREGGALNTAGNQSGPQSPFHSLQAEFVAVAVAWFAVLTATALGGLL